MVEKTKNKIIKKKKKNPEWLLLIMMMFYDSNGLDDWLGVSWKFVVSLHSLM